MVQSDACMERRVRCVLIPSAEFECCLVRVSQCYVEWDQFYDRERTEAMKVGTLKMKCGDDEKFFFYLKRTIF